jgi:hypothetical protein
MLPIRRLATRATAATPVLLAFVGAVGWKWN